MTFILLFNIKIVDYNSFFKNASSLSYLLPYSFYQVDPTGEYGNLVTIQSFKAEFRLAGGINLPKIIDCLGSDGKERRQLVKVRLPLCGVVFKGLMEKKAKKNYSWYFLLSLFVFVFILNNYKKIL